MPSAQDWFAPDDHRRLQGLLERIVQDPASREAARARQAGIWQSFTEAKVAERFWQKLLEHEKDSPKRPAAVGRAKPKLAFVTPLPPDASGVADYSAACLEVLAERAELHVFSDTANPRYSSAYKSVEPVSSIPYVSRAFDGVVSILGNSHFHVSAFERLLKHGSGCVAHDARMINFYAVLYGSKRACHVASHELGRSVAWEEIQSWTVDQSVLPTLFLSEIVETSAPLMVHSRITQQLVKNQYGHEPTYLPFALYRNFRISELNAAVRRQIRERLRLTNSDVLLVSFGSVGLDRAPQEMIWTVEVLRQWGVNARLHFVGKADASVRRHLKSLAHEIGVSDYVKIGSDFISEDDYRDYLLAADAAIQLRTYRLGGLSGSLLDCIAAALPAVANAHLAQAMEAPAFVHAVPDGISPVLVAEKVLEILSIPRFDVISLKEKRDFGAQHNFKVYADRMMQAMSLA